MDFAFSEEQEMLRQQVKRFAQEEVAPRRKEWDREKKYPWPLVQRFDKLGLGDPDMSHVSRGILVEEIAYADFNVAFPILVTTLPYKVQHLPGVPRTVAQPLIDGVRRGEKMLAFCFTEPEAGSDFANFQTTASRDGDGWVINGCKNSISFAGADAYVVWARTQTERTVWSLSAYFIPASLTGVSPPKLWDDMGTRGTPRGVVYFDGVHLPQDYLVGPLGRGYEYAADLFDTNRAYIGLWCIGAAQASVDEGCEYARKRHSLGQPISRYQGVSFTLAEAQTLLEACRLLCYKTLWMADREIRHSIHGAMSKWWVPEVCFDIVRRCLNIHGHYGYTTDLPFEQRLRDILGWQTGDGSGEVCKLIIARSMMGKEFVG